MQSGVRVRLMVTFLLILLYALVVPYILLMVLVIRGMFLREPAPVQPAVWPSVTVVLPAHDEEARLPATLESLSRQEYPGEIEFMIVDDRSGDATPQIIDDICRRDSRFSRLTLTAPGRRLSPKVNAVNAGIRATTGEIIVTTDADCEYPAGWITGLVSHFRPDTVMVVGYVESTRAWAARGVARMFETVDWLSLMLTSRSLTRLGLKFASSANNQAYRRSAFEAAGGFGSSGRAPSGDEDLLTQRLGRLPGGGIVFASTPECRVLTRPVDSGWELLNQRRRWVSRYHHSMHYAPAFLASIATLGAQSIALSLMILAMPLMPQAMPWVLGLWFLKIAVEMVGMGIGTRQLDRPDLWWRPSLGWALAHPFFIGSIVIMSLVRPGDWKGGNAGYRTRFYRRQLRNATRRLRSRPDRV